MREDAIADEASEAAEKYSGGDQKGRRAALSLRACGIGHAGKDCTAGWCGGSCRLGYVEQLGSADDPHLRPIVGELLATFQAHNVVAGGGHALPLCRDAGLGRGSSE